MRCWLTITNGIHLFHRTEKSWIIFVRSLETGQNIFEVNHKLSSGLRSDYNKDRDRCEGLLLVLANDPILATSFRFFDPRQTGFHFKCFKLCQFWRLNSENLFHLLSAFNLSPVRTGWTVCQQHYLLYQFQSLTKKSLKNENYPIASKHFKSCIAHQLSFSVDFYKISGKMSLHDLQSFFLSLA